VRRRSPLTSTTATSHDAGTSALMAAVCEWDGIDGAKLCRAAMKGGLLVVRQESICPTTESRNLRNL